MGRAWKILVVEDDPLVRFGLAGGLRAQGFVVGEADSCATAERALAEGADALVMDLRLPDGDALELLEKIAIRAPTLPVFIVTGHGTIDLAVRAVKQGAEDFLTKPVDVGKLGEFITTAIARKQRNRSGSRRRFDALELVPRSDVMKRIEQEVEKLRNADCSVLLLGETGTGKTVLAQRIHSVGARGGAAFVDVNCAGLTADFFEAELFGHPRGAFTGAHTAKQGLLELADGGTLFLDEIGDVDARVQPKLLKVLEEKRYRRMGEVHERSVDVRLIAATHHDLLAPSQPGGFRPDLYYRISTVTISVPPLRERRDDILPLAHHFIEILGATGVDLATDAKTALLDHPWPGNLRELRNVLERSLLLRSGNVVRAADLRFDRASQARMTAFMDVEPVSSSGAPSASRTLSEMERDHIRSVLEAENGRVGVAAQRLGIPRSTLYQRIKEYGIKPSTLRRAVPRSDPPDGTDG